MIANCFWSFQRYETFPRSTLKLFGFKIAIAAKAQVPNVVFDFAGCEDIAVLQKKFACLQTNTRWLRHSGPTSTALLTCSPAWLRPWVLFRVKGGAPLPGPAGRSRVPSVLRLKQRCRQPIPRGACFILAFNSASSFSAAAARNGFCRLAGESIVANLFQSVGQLNIPKRGIVLQQRLTFSVTASTSRAASSARSIL